MPRSRGFGRGSGEPSAVSSSAAPRAEVNRRLISFVGVTSQVVAVVPAGLTSSNLGAWITSPADALARPRQSQSGGSGGLHPRQHRPLLVGSRMRSSACYLPWVPTDSGHNTGSKPTSSRIRAALSPIILTTSPEGVMISSNRPRFLVTPWGWLASPDDQVVLEPPRWQFVSGRRREKSGESLIGAIRSQQHIRRRGVISQHPDSTPMIQWPIVGNLMEGLTADSGRKRRETLNGPVP
jgi:hypothetical protein